MISTPDTHLQWFNLEMSTPYTDNTNNLKISTPDIDNTNNSKISTRDTDKAE